MRGPKVVFPAPGEARSYWLQEALASDPGAPCPPLQGRETADVCIVGGGFAGLWTGVELLIREPGLRLALIESDICGGGASGRNGGFIAPSWFDLPGLCRLFGDRGGVDLAIAYGEQATDIGKFCAENSLEVWYHNDGSLTFVADWQEGEHDEALACLAAHGLGDRLLRVDAATARAYADSPVSHSGILEPDCATIQPARLARELRRFLLERGARIYENTFGKEITPGHPASVRTPSGEIAAEHVVLTIGAWAASWPGYRTRLANVADYMVVTEPIPDRIKDIGWNSHIGLGDARFWIYYLRKTNDDRIAIGGGNGRALFGGSVGRGATHARSVAEDAARGLLWFFPQLEGVKFDHSWGGPMDMTRSFTPFFQTTDNLHVGLGFSGHGLAPTRVGGKILASLVLGQEDRWSSLPVVGPPIGRWPPEPIRWPFARLGVHAIVSRDHALERTGREPFVRGLMTRAPDVLRKQLKAVR
jgi:glycine/D-amino acid oxidase-like deaminating enzyme